MTQDKEQLSDAKRALLSRYLQGDDTTQGAQAFRRRGLTNTVSSRSPMLALQTGGSKRPFFFLHGDYRDHPVWCLNMVRDLGPDQPVYALEPDTLSGSVAPTFEAHAAAHLRSVRAVQPQGPYLLGGWCGGALLAFEMARQLRAAGQAVDLLVLMEPPLISASTRFVRHFITRFGRVIRLGPARQLGCFLGVRRVYTSVYHRLHHLYRSARPAHQTSGQDIAGANISKWEEEAEQGGDTSRLFPLQAKLDQGSRRPREDYLEIYTWMAADYPVRPYPGQVAIFWAHEDFVRHPRICVEWCRVTPAAEVHVISGTLETCKTQHIHQLASHLSACFDRAQE